MEQRIVTQPAAAPAENGPVVVGVDGSSGSEAALRYAIAEARRRGAPLRVVAAWSIPSSMYMGFALPADFAGDLAAAARAAVDQALTNVGLPADVPVEIVVVEGQAGAVLVAQSQGSAVLVVGSRGLGGFRELLLGSVGQACVHHAGCPVVVVPHPVAAVADGDVTVDAA